MSNKLIKLVFFTFISLFIFSNSYASWITKKSDKSKEIIKKEKKQKSEWIKLKKKEIKANQREFKENKKNISVGTKDWITKRSKKDNYKQSIENLPNNKDQIYLIANSLSTEKVIYGYLDWDDDQFKASLDEGNIKGKSYINDGKTICNIGIDINFGNKMIGTLNGDCTNKTQYNAVLEFTNKQSAGLMVSSTGERFVVDLVSEKNNALKKLSSIKNKNNDSLNNQPTRSKLKVSPRGNYYALLIGNSNYNKWSSLSSPINDVKEIGKILKTKYNFKSVVILENATRAEIFQSLKKLKSIVTDEDYVLIYYGGHGDQETQRAYWIPVDAGKEWDENWIDTITITTAVQRIKAKHILVMIDSCYLGTSFKGKENIDISEADISAKEAIKSLNNRAGIVMASGGATPVVDANIDNKHSLFAYKFIDILKKNSDFITSQNIFLQIKKYHASEQQTPQFYGVANWGHLEGDFVFKVKD